MLGLLGLVGFIRVIGTIRVIGENLHNHLVSDKGGRGKRRKEGIGREEDGREGKRGEGRGEGRGKRTAMGDGIVKY